jgi:hypothetical protein
MSNEDGLPDIGQLPEMGPRQLQAVHRELFGAEHPISNCQHLRRKIAWHVQARREGGLLQSVRALALGIARDATLGARVLENADRRQDAIPVGRAATSTVIEDLDIRGGEPVLAPAPTVVIEVRLDAGVSERPESMLADYELRSEIVRLMDQLDVVRDGWVHRIDVRFGVPRRVLIERARQEVRR